MRFTNVIRLLVNELGTFAWFAFLFQTMLGGHLRLDGSVMGYIIFFACFLVPLVLLVFDYAKMSSRTLFHFVSGVLWSILWLVSGLISGLITMSLGGWVGGWSEGRWYGSVAFGLFAISILFLFVLPGVWFAERNANKKTGD